MFRPFAPKLAAAALAALLLIQPLAPTLGLAANTATVPAYTRTLKLGSSGTDVKTLQQKLKDLGYFSGATTTQFGSITMNAVKAFQKAKKLTADGIVGRVTFNALFSGTQSAPTATAGASATATPVNTSGSTFTRTLKMGCKGTDVQSLQQRLKDLGFFSTSVTTTFGSVTLSSVKSFQKAKGLSADGIVGRITFDALFLNAQSNPSTSASATSTTPTYQYGRLQNQTALKKGNSGDDVRDLQTALKQKGYFTGDVTGSFDTKTQDAVMKFQRAMGLDMDGIAGNYTLSALYSLLNPPDLNAIKAWPDPALAAQWSALQVEKLTWTDADTKAFPRGSDAWVVDVKTGYTFKIRRTGGTLHADVETLTAADTATLYKTAGNTFTWNRHAVWVIVGNRRLAASMNCMPHGYDSIAANDMKGQFCIHFVDSKTHGSNKVDADHQKAIETAFTTPMVVPGTTVSATTSTTPSATISITPTGSATATATAEETIAPAA